MARPPKIPAGDKRQLSILLRGEQVEAANLMKAALGLELPDVIRGLLDWALPLDPADLACRGRAAVELLWRGVEHSDPLRSVVVAGWRGKPMLIPVEAAVTRADVRQLTKLVGMLTALGLPAPAAEGEDADEPPAAELPPGQRQRRPSPLPRRPPALADWAAWTPHALLTVLSTPAVRVFDTDVDGGGRPLAFLASAAVRSPASEPDGPRVEVEMQYDHPAVYLRELLALGGVRPIPGQWARLPWEAFEICWDRLPTEPRDG